MVDIQRTITSNITKVLKHLDKLQDIQQGKPVSPVMVHLALTNACNLDCSYCCYGGRHKIEKLSLEQALDVIDQFHALGTKGLEITGGGDPLLHKDVNYITEYAKFKGMSLGLISNGLAYKRFNHWDKLDWVRLSSHALNKGNEQYVELFTSAINHVKPLTNLGSVHIYTGDDKNLDNVVKFMEHYNIPTRITPDLTKSPEWIKSEMPRVKGLLDNFYKAKYCFISDFNIKFERPDNTCYVKLIKPYIHPDGIVYQCPGASFSPENFCNVDPKYKVCNIEDILTTYSNPNNLLPKEFDCRFCKYQQMNDLIKDIRTETRDNDFA